MPIEEVKFEEKDVKQLLQPVSGMVKFWRLVKRAVKNLALLFALFLFFYVLINFGAFKVRFSYTITKPAETVITPPPVVVPVVDYAPEIIIPKLSVQAPVLLNVEPEQIVEQLRNGVTHYADTALPGQIGNTVLIGHSSDFPWSPGNYKNIFALLDKLVIGDQITVPYKTQHYVYEVIETKVVKPTELSVLRKTSTPQLTLITCYPVGTTQKRLIIIAKLVSGQTIGDQTTEPILESLPRTR